METGINTLVERINDYAKENGDFFTMRTIAKKGFLFGAKYVSVKKLVDNGQLKAATLNLGSMKRSPIKKIHYLDLIDYLTKNYN